MIHEIDIIICNACKKNGLEFFTILCSHSPGNNKDNLHFIGQISEPESMSDAFSHSQQVVYLIENNVPTFHTRAMRRAMFTKFGRIEPSIKPSVLRYFYCDLTGDASAANTAEELS